MRKVLLAVLAVAGGFTGQNALSCSFGTKEYTCCQPLRTKCRGTLVARYVRKGNTCAPGSLQANHICNARFGGGVNAYKGNRCPVDQQCPRTEEIAPLSEDTTDALPAN